MMGSVNIGDGRLFVKPSVNGVNARKSGVYRFNLYANMGYLVFVARQSCATHIDYIILNTLL